jgi:phosphoribosylamine--glycine ligase
MDLQQAEEAVRDMLAGNAFGEAGHRVVIEEFLDGEEASFIVMADGVNVLPMATSQDHKRVGAGDTGPNTGGMGAYSPAPVVNDTVYQRIMHEVIYPTVKGMADEGNTYTGFLYAGLMIMADGTPKVIEYNCRFGDPETQPIMLRMQSDLVDHCLAALSGELDSQQTTWDPRPSVGIVLAAGGYPNAYNKGDIISGLPDLNPSQSEALTSEKVFHAGTQQIESNICTNGGRVLCATALGGTVLEAQQQAYNLASSINWDGMFFRDDIAWRAILREQKN